MFRLRRLPAPFLLAGMLGLILTVFGAGCGSDSSAKPTPGAGSALSFDGAQAMAHLTKLAGTIGPRVPGSGGDQAAAAYIAGEFSRMRYSVIHTTVSYDAAPNREATLDLSGTKVAAVTAAGSAAGSGSGPGAWIGLGDGPLAPASLSGKVAVAARGGATFTSLHDTAKAAGAVALVIINNEAGPFAARLDRPASIPVVGVAGAEGTAVRSAAERGAAVSVSVPDGGTIATEDIVARPPNGDPCQIIIGAHYDTLAGTDGANNNASGVAVLLELAEQMRIPSASPRLCFVAFGGTVDGLRGSETYVSKIGNAPAGSGLAAMVNLYGLGTGKSLVVYGDSVLANDAKEAAVQAGIDVRFAGASPSYATDAKSFAAARVPALDFTSNDFSSALIANDPPSNIDEKALTSFGRAALALVRLLAVRGRP